MLQVQKIESQKLALTEQEELKLKRRGVQKERTLQRRQDRSSKRTKWELK